MAKSGVSSNGSINKVNAAIAKNNYTALIKHIKDGIVFTTEQAQTILASNSNKGNKFLNQLREDLGIQGSAIVVLHRALMKNEINIARFLINNVPEQNNSIDNNGNIALHYAAYCGRNDIVELLIEKVPEQISIQNKEGLTALHYAADRGHLDVVKSLIGKAPGLIVIKTKNGHTALDYARHSGHAGIAEFLMKQAPEQIAIALTEAVIKGKKNTVERLIAKAPEQIIIQDRNGLTALHWAVKNGQTDIATFLINNMSPEQICIQDGEGKTALHWAAQKGLKATVELLLQKSSDQIAIQDRYRQTALHFAITGNCLDVVRLLVNEMSPEQIAIKDVWGQTALSLVDHEAGFSFDRRDIEALLLRIQGRNLHLLIADHPKLTKLILKLIDKVSLKELVKKDENGETALHIAAAAGRDEIAAKLIEKLTLTQVAATNNQGKSALMIAIINGFAYIVQLLSGRLATEKKIQDDLFVSYKQAAVREAMFTVDGALSILPLQSTMQPERIEENKFTAKRIGESIFAAMAADPSKVDSQGKSVLIKLLEIYKDDVGGQVYNNDENLRIKVNSAYSEIVKSNILSLIDIMTPDQLRVRDKKGNTAESLAARIGLDEEIVAKLTLKLGVPETKHSIGPNKTGSSSKSFVQKLSCQRAFRCGKDR